MTEMTRKMLDLGTPEHEIAHRIFEGRRRGLSDEQIEREIKAEISAALAHFGLLRDDLIGFVAEISV